MTRRAVKRNVSTGFASALNGSTSLKPGKMCKAMVPDTTSASVARAKLAELPAADLADLIQQLTDQMHSAAAELQFELAARLRDEIGELKKELRGMRSAGHA